MFLQLRRVWHSKNAATLFFCKSRTVHDLDKQSDYISSYVSQKDMVYLKSAASSFFSYSGWICPRKLMSYISITCTNDPLDEFYVEMTIHITCKILYKLKESHKNVFGTTDF